MTNTRVLWAVFFAIATAISVAAYGSDDSYTDALTTATIPTLPATAGKVSVAPAQTPEPVTDDRASAAPAQTSEPVADDKVSAAPAQTSDPVADDKVSGVPAQALDPVANDKVSAVPAQTLEPVADDKVSVPASDDGSQVCEDYLFAGRPAPDVSPGFYVERIVCLTSAGLLEPVDHPTDLPGLQALNEGLRMELLATQRLAEARLAELNRAVIARKDEMLFSPVVYVDEENH